MDFFYFWTSWGKLPNFFFFFIWIPLRQWNARLFVKAVWPSWWLLSVRVHLDVQIRFKMTFMGKHRWDSMINNSSPGYILHGGSVPNLLSPPSYEFHVTTLKKRLSMEVLRGLAPDLGSLSMGLNLNLRPVKWPSLITVCKWKQTLTEKLKKRHCGTKDESQVRKLTNVKCLEGYWHPFV